MVVSLRQFGSARSLVCGLNNGHGFSLEMGAKNARRVDEMIEPATWSLAAGGGGLESARKLSFESVPSSPAESTTFRFGALDWW